MVICGRTTDGKWDGGSGGGFDSRGAGNGGGTVLLV